MILTPDDLVAIERLLTERRDLSLPPVLPFASSVVQIASAGIAAAAFVPGAIDAAAIADGAIDAATFAAGAIDAAAIATGAIDADAIAAAALTASKFGAFALAGQIVRSIQYGLVSIASGANSGTATITSVDTTKTALLYLGGRAATSLECLSPTITLTNATTVTADRDELNAFIVRARFCVLEFA